MADKDDKNDSFPWVPLVASVGVLTSFLAFLPQITSSRPGGGDPKLASESSEPQAVTARLWQDPLGVAMAESERLKSERLKSEQERANEHSIEVFQWLFFEKCHGPNAGSDGKFNGVSSRLAVFAVMVPGGPYVEDVERRLRARRAVIEALTAAGYQPEREHELKYFSVSWELLAGDPATAIKKIQSERNKEVLKKVPNIEGSFWWRSERQDPPRVIVPYEWYVKDPESPQPASCVLVLWLNDERFLDAPLARIADLNSWLCPHSQENSCSNDIVLPKINVFGPDNSATLHTIALETAAQDWDETTRRLLATTHVYSCSATASDEQILRGVTAERTQCKQFIENAMTKGQSFPGFTFDRTLPLDDEIVKTMWKELGAWGVGKHPHDTVAVISELDTFYARALSATFQTLDKKKKPPFAIEPYSYLRGIDGKLPVEEKAQTANADADKSGKSNQELLHTAEQTEGLNRADDVRRLAKQMQARYGRNGTLKAIGLLGSDVYDKLEILKALRPAFPEAVFFTNNLDARMAHPDERDETHNLIVVSPFDLYLDGEIPIPPFRDSAQTALYAAVLDAAESRTLGKYAPVIKQVGSYGFEDIESPSSRNQVILTFAAVAGIILTAVLLVGWIKLVSQVSSPSEKSDIFHK